MPLENGLDDRLITSSDLQQYFVNKANGEANAYGSIRFWVDSDRTVPKTVYELVQDVNTSNYSYVPLPNPLTLSGVGTVVDANNNDIPIYWFPYDGTPDESFGNVELYYVEVLDANGQIQFTREAWPYPLIEGGNAGPTISSLGIVNQLTNPQFTKVLFTPGSTLNIGVTGSGTTDVEIAPGWTLEIVHTASGNVTVTQNAIAGTQALPYNPPFTLTVSGNSSVTNLSLYQQLNNNPDWAAPSTSLDSNGFLAGSILLGPGTGVDMQYVASAGNSAQSIVFDTNNTGSYAQFQNTIQLDPANNPQTGLVGYDRIVINFSNPAGTSIIGNVQVLPLTSEVEGILFEQTPANRQLDQMFNYYKAGLDFKPIPSYLIGWDFGLNPAQFLGHAVGPIASGANTSNYFYDQTIIFQSANSGVSGASGTDRMALTAAATTQLAIIQYLEADTLAAMLANNLSANIYGYTSQSSGLPITISLWVTTNTTLPNAAANASLVTALDATGYPTVAAGWTELPRSNIANQRASFTMSQSTAPADYGFSGWGRNFTALSTSTFFAIVIGTGTLNASETLNLVSASLVPGDIPTRPAPQSVGEVLRACQRFWWTTIPSSLGVPANNLGLTNAITYRCQISGTTAGYTVTVTCPVQMRAGPNVTFYNPQAGAAGCWYNFGLPGVSGVASLDPVVSSSATTSQLAVKNLQVAGDTPGNGIAVHLAADSRLGIV